MPPHSRGSAHRFFTINGTNNKTLKSWRNQKHSDRLNPLECVGIRRGALGGLVDTLGNAHHHTISTVVFCTHNGVR